MYGDSKGMIAIIEALRNADLEVTVMDGRYQKVFEEQAKKQPISRILALKRSLGVPPTNSDMTSRLDKSCTTQICEGRYTNTYQMAHCNQIPASLQVTLSKSSLQRSCYVSHASNGLSLTPASEAFVCSLRKYPRMPPGRSDSAEMVQRLINYTRSKHLKKLSHKSRSRRSLREITKTNKQKWANNRIQSKANGRKISLVKDDEFKIEEKKDLKLQPTVSDVKYIQYHDKYDYFKHPSQNKSRHSAEVRYLSDITKYLRDKLQNISEDRPFMCQKMRNRYTNHERQYHPDRHRPRVASHQKSRVNSANMEVQASGPSISKAVLTDDTENINADVPSLLCYKNCRALRAFKKLSIATDASPKRIINEAITEWVKSIPVNSAENYNERKNREDLINQLTKNLENIANSDDFYEQSRALIENCVNEMPLWNPGNESEQNILKSRVIENLHNKLINQKSTNIFKEYFDKPHELRKCVSKWLDEMGIEEKDSKGNLIDKERIIDELVEKFNNVEVTENNKKQLFESVKKKLQESVNNLPLELKNVTCETVNNVFTGEEDIINQEKNNYNSKHINMNKNKDEERENLLNTSREAENQKRGQLNDFTGRKIKETTATNVKLSRGVNNNNVENSQSNINSYNNNEDLAKALLENNVTENKLSVTPKEIVDNDNIEMIATKIANILMYEINQNKRQDTLNRSTLNEKDDLFHSIVKELIKDWGQQTSNLDNSADTNTDFSELAKQILDIRSSNMRIQDIIGQIKNIDHNKTIDAAVEKLRRFLEDANNKRTEDQLTKKIDQETLKESVCAEIKDLMEYWGDKITKLQTSIDKNPATDEITKQLMEIKVNFMNLKEILSHMHNTVPDKSVNAIITKSIHIKQKGDKLNDELLNEDIEKSNIAKLKQLITEWSDHLWKLQVNLIGNKAKDDLTKQINQIKLTNTNIENILKPLENKIPNETLEGITARLIEMSKDNQEKILDDRNIATIRTDLKKAISSEVNKLLKDWESKLANLESQVGKSKDIEELTNKIIEIQLMIANIEEMLSHMKALVSSETLESVSLKISSILIKGQEKMRQEELNKETLTNEIAQVVRLKLKEIMDEWSKNPVTESLPKILLETELINTNIEEIISQIKYTISSQTVEGIVDKLSELFTKDNQDKSLLSKVDKAIDKAVNTEIKSLMEDCNKKIEGLINSIEQNTMIPLNKKLTQSTNTNIENEISQVKNHVPVDITERVTVTLSKCLNKSQNKDVAPNGAPFGNARKAKYRLILNEESAANNFSNTDNTHLSRGNQSDIYSQSPGPPSMVENATIRPENNNYKGIHSTSSSVRRANDNIFKKDKDSSYTQNMHHSDRSRYHEDTRSLTDLHNRNSGIETNKFKIQHIEELIEHIKTLQTREVDQDIILDEIDDYLDTLIRNNELDLTFEDRDIISKKLLTYLEDNRPRKRWDQSDDKRKSFLNDISYIIDSKPSNTNNSYTMTTSKRVNILEKDTGGNDMNETPSGNFVESIREELNELLQQYNVSITNKELEDMISQILSDQVMRGVDMDKTRGILYSMLQEDNISKSKAADISMKLVDRVKEMSLAYKALDSNIAFNRSKVKTSPFHNEAFKRSAEKVVHDFIDEFCNNSHSQNITKQKALGSIKELVDLIISILSNPEEDTEDILKGAIWEFFAKNYFQSESPIVDLVDELGDRVLNIVINSSTPKKDKRSILKRNTAETTMNHENRASIKKDLCYCDADELESDYTDILRKVISHWIEDLHMRMDEEFKTNMIEDLVRDTMDWQRYLQINPTTIEPDRDLEHLKYQVFRWLNNLSDFHEFSDIVPGVDNLMKKIKDVFLHISIKNTKGNRSEFGNKIAEETFDSILEEWFVSLPTRDPKSCLELLEIEKLKSDFKFRLERLCNNLNNAEMREEIRKFLIDFPFLTKNNNDKFIDDKVNDLIELLENVPLNNNRMHGDISEILIIEDENEINRNVSKDLSLSGLGNSSLQSIGPLNSMNNSCNNLNDYIFSWFENLFEINDEKPLMYLKQNLASRLINKINELNLNKDILDDEYLYKELVEDEINSLLNELPINLELTSEIKGKKIDLIYMILESREKTKQELACQQYKRNLRDIISKSLAILSSKALQELAALDILKDNLADAYINLRFYGADSYLKEKYKTRIANEITKFCTEYLKICPQLPVNNNKLNTDLFNALEKVDTPGEETLTREIEQTRIRDEINEWLKEMPVKEQNKTELLQQNKKIALLAKALHDIESQMEVNNSDTTNQMKNLILKFLQKLPLQISNKEDINNFADKLVENLYRSESSRRYSQSKSLKSLRDISIIELETVDSNGNSKIRRKSVLGSTNVDSIIKPAANKETVDSSVGCNMNELIKNNAVEGTNILPQSHTVISIPPSTLTTADKAHLEEIRQRTSIATKYTLISRKRDAAVSPLPVDVAIRTDIIPVSKTKDVPNTSKQISPQENYKIIKPIVHSVRSKSLVRQSANGTEVDDNQEMKATGGVVKATAGSLLNNEQRQKNEVIFESKQSARKTSALASISPKHSTESLRLTIRDANQNLETLKCPGIQMIAPCHNKTCPSVKDLIHQELDKEEHQRGKEKTFLAENTNAGSSTELLPSKSSQTQNREISPKVIIKEYYWNSNNTPENNPNQSKDNTNINHENQYNNVAQNDTTVSIIDESKAKQDINEEFNENSSFHNINNRNINRETSTSDTSICPIVKRWRKHIISISTQTSDPCDKNVKYNNLVNEDLRSGKSLDIPRKTKARVLSDGNLERRDWSNDNDLNSDNSNDRSKGESNVSRNIRLRRRDRFNENTPRNINKDEPRHGKSKVIDRNARQDLENVSNINLRNVVNGRPRREANNRSKNVSHDVFLDGNDLCIIHNTPRGIISNRKSRRHVSVGDLFSTHINDQLRGQNGTEDTIRCRCKEGFTRLRCTHRCPHPSCLYFK